MTLSRIARGGALVMSLMMMADSARAYRMIPIYRVSISGGQYFIFGSRANLSGNGSAIVAPAIEFNDRWTLIPMYTGDFRGTKGIGDGVGAGTLFQQQMNHRLSATGIYTPTDSTWRFKPSLSYKRQFLNETNNETWGNGLFDFEKISLGFELENVYKKPFSYRFGYDAYRVRFPNYSSLESQSGVDPSGNPLGRELAGTNVLDTYNHRLSFSGNRPYPYDDPKYALSASYSLVYQDYLDQRIVNSKGQFEDKKPFARRDFQQTLSLTVGAPSSTRLFGKQIKLNRTFTLTGGYLGSNQNTFDATSGKFIFDSYSYYSYGAGPGYSLSWGDPKSPARIDFSFRYTRVQYTGRLAQGPNGQYKGEHQFQDRYVFSTGYSYPIAANFTLTTKASALWATSNNKFEKTYPYTYRTANYFMGFTYDY